MVTVPWAGAIALGVLLAVLTFPPRVTLESRAGSVSFHPAGVWKLTQYGAAIELVVLIGFSVTGLLNVSWLAFIGAFLAVGVPIHAVARRVCRGALAVREDVLAKFYWWEFQPTQATPRFLRPDVQLLLPAGPAFELPHIVLCADLSWLAYQDAQTIETRLKALAWNCTVIANDELLCFVGVVGTEVFVSFRGTNQMRNWLTNLHVLRVDGPWGKVHGGFLRALDALYPRIIEVLKSSVPAPSRVWVTGHSLGGALATLCAARLKVETICDSLVVVTFGQPAVGDPAFRSEFERQLGSSCLRVVNFRDEVPRQPPGYVQAGNAQYLDRRGQLRNTLGMFDFLEQSRGIAGEHVMLEYSLLLENLFEDQSHKLHAVEQPSTPAGV